MTVLIKYWLRSLRILRMGSVDTNPTYYRENGLARLQHVVITLSHYHTGLVTNYKVYLVPPLYMLHSIL